MIENRIHIHNAALIANRVEDYGILAARLFIEVGLEADLLDRAEPFMSTEEYSNIVVHALQLCGDPALGLHAGKRVALNSFGVLGQAHLFCENIGQALSLSQDFQILYSPIFMDYWIEDDQCILELLPSVHFDNEEVRRYVIEESLSTAYGDACFLAQTSLPLTEIRLPYRRPTYADDYAVRFPCPVRFGEGEMRVTFPAEVLEYSVVMHDPDMLDMCMRECRRRIDEVTNEDDLIRGIRQLLSASSERFPGLDEIARRLHMSPRNLRYQLRRRNTNFRTILDETRKKLAMEYLQGTTIGIDAIAGILGFQETTSFRKAFKKWAGVSATFARKSARISG